MTLSRSKFSRFGSVLRTGLAAAALALGLGRAAQAQQVLWEDDFPVTSSGTVDVSKWSVSTNSNFIHRTRFGDSPQVLAEGATTFARLNMKSYNPNSAGSFLGTEMWSLPEWSVGTGLEWEARVRGTKVPKGICYAFFSYRRRDFAFDPDQEEIDFEFLSNWINSEDPYLRRSVWTNVWNDGTSSGQSQAAPSSLDQTQWHTYTIRWRANSVEWLVDGASVRTETNLVPDDQMAICLNIWAPDSSWTTAYDSSLTTASSANASTTNYFDVDYVRVRRMAAPTNQGSIGGGEGLTGVYYNTVTQAGGAPQFSNERFSDFARRVSFSASTWGSARFDARLDSDGWGAVFKGEVQAQYSQPTTFSLATQSSDGVRLWLGNQLVISKTPTSGADTTVESSGTVSLQAGARYPIRIEFWDGSGSASLQLYWSSASLPKQLVGSTQLYPFTLPAPTLSPAPSTYTTAQTVRAANSEAGADFHYTLDGSEPQYASPLFPANGLGVSTSTTVRVKSWKEGYWASPVAGGTYYIDGVAPVLALDSPRSNQNYTSLLAVSGTASDSGSSGLDRVLVRLSRASDGAFLNVASSTWGAQIDNVASLNGGNWSLALPGLADGSYTVRAQSVDRAGNASAAQSASFVIDANAPILTMDTPAADGFVTSLGAAGGSATDAGLGVTEVRARLQRASDGAFWNASTWTAAAADIGVNFAAPRWSLNLPPLDQGSYTLTLTAFDAARNSSSLVRLFGVDTGAPQLSIGGPAANAVLKSGFVLNGSASDAVSGVASVGVRIQRASDGAFWNGSTWGADTELAARLFPNNAGGVDWTLAVPLFADGAYTAFVTARDRTGIAASASVAWRADATAPLVSVLSPAPNTSASTWGAPSGSFSDGDQGSGVVAVAIALRNGDAFWNGSAWSNSASTFAASVAGTAWNWPAIALPPAVDGPYAVEATAVDGAGNSATARSAFSIAVPAPTPVATSTPVPVPTATPTTAPTATPAPVVDRTAPVASVASPPHNSVWRTMPILRGLATDNFGVASVQVNLLRYADRRSWNGSTWAAGATLRPSLSGGVWMFSRVPSGAALSAGLYSVTATVTDTAGLRAVATSVFRIDEQAPVITFVRPSASPSLSVLTSPPTQLVIRAQDDAAGTRLAEVMLWRRSDGRYWNGRSWGTGLIALPLQAINPTKTARPSAILWQNAFALPPASQWLPGSYTLIVRANDWAANASTSRLEFTLAAPSPFVPSSASASAASATATLAFSGPLDVASAQSSVRFRVQVNGVTHTVRAARYSVATRSITLSLAGTVVPGARVQIWWSGLTDSTRRTVRDGTIATTSR